MEFAGVSALLAAGLGVVGTVPYVFDTVRRSTVPHRGSWLIWSVLGVVAVESQRADGARWSLLPLIVQALGTCVVLLLSIRLGRGGLSGAEIGLLFVAGVGVVGWHTAGEPVIATGCVILADLIGALLMAPKAWRDPSSETCSLFVMASLGGAATAGAVGVVAAPLLIYPTYFCLINGSLATMIALRRWMLRSVPATGAMTPAVVDYGTRYVDLSAGGPCDGVLDCRRDLQDPDPAQHGSGQRGVCPARTCEAQRTADQPKRVD